MSLKILVSKTQKILCIDLILTNCSWSFQITSVFETGLSHFRKLTFTVLKQYYLKQKHKLMFYRKCKSFRNDFFRSELEHELSNHDIYNIDICLRTYFKILDNHVPL